MRDKELATIKPSEHLELVMFRIEDKLHTYGVSEVNYKDWQDHVLHELDRLRSYLEERGE